MQIGYSWGQINMLLLTANKCLVEVPEENTLKNLFMNNLGWKKEVVV